MLRSNAVSLCTLMLLVACQSGDDDEADSTQDDGVVDAAIVDGPVADADDDPADAAIDVDAQPGMADAAPSMPDAAAGMPDAAAGLPDAAAGMPDAATGLPDAATGLPDAAAGMPDAATVMPDAAPSMPDAAPTVSFASDVQPIFTSRCSGCHGGSAGLTLSAGNAYAELVNKPTEDSGDGACANLLRVDTSAAADPSKSALYLRLSGTSCTFQMPFGGPYLNATDLGIIEAWIRAGAPNN